MVGVYQVYPKKRKSFLGNLSVNTILIISNVILFFAFLLLINFKILTWDHIAIQPLNFISGTYLWTILSSMFMHGGFFHLFVNMFSLFFVGSLIQKIIGKKR